ncbi:MAG: helix-turn-helix domain-containing protein [Pseudomonadota bacterium]
MKNRAVKLSTEIIRRDRYEIQVTLVRALSILEFFASSQNRWQSVKSVCEATGLPQPTITRYLKSLRADGYLTYSIDTHKYALGCGVLTLGYGCHRYGLDGSKTDRALQGLADTYGVHVAIFEREKNSVVCVRSLHSRTNVVSLQIEVGFSKPLHSHVGGRVILADLSEVEFRYMIDVMKNSAKAKHEKIDWSITTAKAQFATKGYVEAKWEGHPSLLSVAFPIVNDNGAKSASLVCSFIDGSMSTESYLSMLQAMKRITGF